MSRSIRILSWIACAWLAAACGDNHETPKDAAPPDDGPDPALGPCLPRPTDLPRPPTGALPCELLPPGFTPAR
ncbi:MAG TPA: hypothetical protein VK932_03670 [Kofleriaceae bacterium]|nr:hypothetical protein [Kofleriaceae bacterium]